MLREMDIPRFYVHGNSSGAQVKERPLRDAIIEGDQKAVLVKRGYNISRAVI